MIYIIGSGLTGIAAARALVARGIRPTILDAGLRADPETAALKARLASMEPEAWNPEDLAHLKRTGVATACGIPRKLQFGSDFAYREMDPPTTAHFHQASILRSFARGGFSNVWGAVIHPLKRRDLQRWPVSFETLGRHYHAVERLISPSGAPVKPTVQARAVQADLTRYRRSLQEQGVHFDYATLAVRSSDDESGKGCRHCGLCLYGCPYDSIFSAAAQLDEMVRKGQAAYRPNILVDRVSTTRSGMRVEGRSAVDNAPCSFEGRQVFLAAGVLESARIVLNSTGHLTARLRVYQSDIFTIPLLRYRSTPEADRERIHTLCQTVVDIDDPSICGHSVQLQLYGYNDLYSRIMAQRTGPLSRALGPLFRAVSARLLVAFGYLHSDVSSSLWMTRMDSTNGRLRIEGQANRDRNRMGAAVVAKLFRVRKGFQAVPIPLQLRFDEPGGSHRIGGCFPMRKNPAELDTDEWGGIPALPGLHIVDASILPTVPAGPLAFTVMANAHRIAAECPIPVHA